MPSCLSLPCYGPLRKPRITLPIADVYPAKYFGPNLLLGGTEVRDRQLSPLLDTLGMLFALMNPGDWSEKMRFGISLLCNRVSPRCTIADSVLLVTSNRGRILGCDRIQVAGNAWIDLLKLIKDNQIDVLVSCPINEFK